MSLVGSLSLKESTGGSNSRRMEGAMEDRTTSVMTTLRGRAMAVARAIGAQIGSILEIEIEATKVVAVEVIVIKAVVAVEVIVIKALGSMGKEEITAECETITRELHQNLEMETAKIMTRDSHKVEVIEIEALTSVIINKI